MLRLPEEPVESLAVEKPANLGKNHQFSVRTVLKLPPLWIALLVPIFVERSLLGSKTCYFLYIGLALVFVMYGISVRSVFHYLQHTGREPIFAWVGYLGWTFFLCCVLSVFAFEYDLLPHPPDAAAGQGRQLIDYLYYEVMTFTTVGYGDIVPATGQGKVLAMCSALLGATHGVTFVSLILQALSRPRSKSEE